MIKLITVICLVAVSFVQCQRGIPPFLENAPAATQQAFQQMMAGAGNKNDAQVDQMVLDWISHQDASVKAAFDNFVQKIKEVKAKGEAAHQAALAKFSPEAKAADARLTAIAKDPSKTMQQKAVEINKVLESIPQNVRSEIETAMKG